MYPGEIGESGGGNYRITLPNGGGHYVNDQQSCKSCCATCQRQERPAVPPMEIVPFAQFIALVGNDGTPRVENTVTDVNAPCPTGEQERNPPCKANIHDSCKR